MNMEIFGDSKLNIHQQDKKSRLILKNPIESGLQIKGLGQPSHSDILLRAIPMFQELRNVMLI